MVCRSARATATGGRVLRSGAFRVHIPGSVLRRLLNVARYGTAHHIEQMVRNYRRCRRLKLLHEDRRNHALREISWHPDVAAATLSGSGHSARRSRSKSPREPCRPSGTTDRWTTTTPSNCWSSTIRKSAETAVQQRAEVVRTASVDHGNGRSRPF